MRPSAPAVAPGPGNSAHPLRSRGRGFEAETLVPWSTRRRFAVRKRFAALATFGLAAVLGSVARAQDDKTATGDRNRDQSGAQVIRGVVAGVTAEGELAIDYRTNRAVLVQAAYLTVVGSPVRGQGGA